MKKHAAKKRHKKVKHHAKHHAVHHHVQHEPKHEVHNLTIAKEYVQSPKHPNIQEFLKEHKIILRAEHLTKQYKKFKAVDNVSLDIKKGEKLGVVGINGAGKTTLVEMLCGVKQPTKGKVYYAFGNTKAEISKNLGMQFQESTYPDGVTVNDMVTFYSQIYNVNKTHASVQSLLKDFGLENHQKKTIKSLSGGLQQRLNILLAVLHSPKLLILDEVSTGLDIAGKKEIMIFIKKVIHERKMTLILISHNMEEIEVLCDDLVLVSKGKILERSTVEHVKTRYGTVDNWATKSFEEGRVS